MREAGYLTVGVLGVLAIAYLTKDGSWVVSLLLGFIWGLVLMVSYQAGGDDDGI